MLAWSCALGLAAVARAQVSYLPPQLGDTYDQFGTKTDWAAQLTSVPALAPGDHPIETIAGADGIAMGGAAPTAGANFAGVRVIYFGSSTTADLDFGVTLGGAIAGARTSLRDGATANAAGLGVTMVADVGGTATSFRFWDLALPSSVFPLFDIWMNVANEQGGLFHAFHSGWDSGPAGAPGGNAYWSQPFVLNTRVFDPTTNSVQSRATTTYLLSFEDAQDDDDRSDLVLGIQFLQRDVHPTPTSAVPEPAATGAAGAGALAALGIATAALRRRRAGGRA